MRKAFFGAHALPRLQAYLEKRIDRMVSLTSVHKQTRQLNLTIPSYQIKLTGSRVN